MLLLFNVDPIEIVRKYYDAYASGSVLEELSLLDENVYFEFSGSVIPAQNMKYASKKTYLFQRIKTARERYVETGFQYTVEGFHKTYRNYIVVHFMSHRGYPDYPEQSNKYRIQANTWFQVKDGKIITISTEQVPELRYLKKPIAYYYDYDYNYDKKDAYSQDPVSIIEKVYAAMKQGDDAGVLKYVADDCQVNIYGSGDPLINGKYVNNWGFSEYLSRRKASFTEAKAKYTVIGLDKAGSSGGWKKVDGKIDAEHTYTDGSTYFVNYTQRYWIGRTGKIQRVVSKMNLKKLAPAKEEQSYPSCLNNCAYSAQGLSALPPFPTAWGKGPDALLKEIDDSLGVHAMMDCVCTSCGEYPEVKALSEREKVCARAKGSPGPLISK